MPPRMLFADTFYWVALLNPGDAYHARVKSLGSDLGTARLVTTDEVLTEVLNWFSRSGRHWRGEATILIHDLRSDADVDVLPQTRADLSKGKVLYEKADQGVGSKGRIGLGDPIRERAAAVPAKAWRSSILKTFPPNATVCFTPAARPTILAVDHQVETPDGG